jgi:hypothetical protein
MEVIQGGQQHPFCQITRPAENHDGKGFCLEIVGEDVAGL